jgi:5-oxoprolinase (ATP-hydrolysing)
MQSDGGLTPMDNFNGSRAVLSGPAGGVVGYAITTQEQFSGRPVIGFDMGGTSTDVSRYDGKYEHVFESTTAGVCIQAPQLDINTVAAGGGSMLFFRSGMFIVGPESAGANPGPACYGRGGPITVTDANLILGRLLPKYFPRVFGETDDEPLQTSAAMTGFKALTHEINHFMMATSPSFKEMTVQEVAMGFVEVANVAMCRPIRAMTQVCFIFDCQCNCDLYISVSRVKKSLRKLRYMSVVAQSLSTHFYALLRMKVGVSLRGYASMSR